MVAVDLDWRLRSGLLDFCEQIPRYDAFTGAVS
jgi:hypothetical protein